MAVVSDIKIGHHRTSAQCLGILPLQICRVASSAEKDHFFKVVQEWIDVRNGNTGLVVLWYQ